MQVSNINVAYLACLIKVEKAALGKVGSERHNNVE